MNKISLVSRRLDKSFDTPTRASQRAHERMEEQIAGTDTDSDQPQDKNSVSVSIQEGSPTVEIDLPNDKHVDFECLATEYLQGKDKTMITTEISKEKIGDKWELKLQFMPEHPSKLLTAKELAAMLGVSITTVYTMRKNNGIKSYKVGNSWRFMWSEVLEALENK